MPKKYDSLRHNREHVKKRFFKTVTYLNSLFRRSLLKAEGKLSYADFRLKCDNNKNTLTLTLSINYNKLIRNLPLTFAKDYNRKTV